MHRPTRYERAKKPTTQSKPISKTSQIKPVSKPVVRQEQSKSQPRKEIIIRVIGKDGNWRFELPPSEKVGHIKQLVSAKTGVPMDKITFAKVRHDPKFSDIYNDGHTLQQAGITHGTAIYFSYPKNLVSKQDKEEEEKKKLLKYKFGNQITGQEYFEWIEKNTIHVTPQGYSICRSVSIDQYAAEQFSRFLRETGFTIQRMGYLYGHTEPGEKPEFDEEDAKKFKIDENDNFEDVFVSVIYEPPQHGDIDGFVEEKDTTHADTIANLLGLKKVGWIFTRPGGEREAPMTGEEIIKTAELQAKYGPSFVTIQVFPNEDGLPEFHAFQVSKQAVELQKLGLLQVDEDNPFVVKIKKSEEKFVKFNKREVDSLENVLLVNNVAIKAFQGPFLTGFPPKNRPISDYTQSMEVLKRILQQRRNMKFVKRVSDFHLLLFLVDYLSLSSDMPVLCEAVRTQNQNAAEGFEHLINAYCGL